MNAKGIRRHYNNKNDNYDVDYGIGSDTWLLRKMVGSRVFDKILLNLIKILYIGSRSTLRFILGKKRRDEIWIKKNMSFKKFLYLVVGFLKLDNVLLIEFYAPKYNFKFYSKVTGKVNNHRIDDVYKSMTSHEDDVVEKFVPRSGDVVVDIGAAFGFYSILASKKAGETGRIIAIEPQPDNFAMLNLNIGLNKLTNVTTLNYAVYSKEEELPLYSSYSILSERSEKNKMDFVKVKGFTLDYLLRDLNGIKKVNWIKIDVEGAELDVLRGAHHTLSESNNLSLLIEVHGKDNLPHIINLLNSYNFKIMFEKTYEWGDKHMIWNKHSEVSS
ncbi:MAG: FkbM family methyltransferase [Thermoproteota archaeon]|nr:FkbM family methyltransferase [Thermoproteota archaeon]